MLETTCNLVIMSQGTKRILTALEELPDGVLQSVTKFLGLKHTKALSEVNQTLHVTTKYMVQDLIHEHRAKQIQRFWRWCKNFKITHVLVHRYIYTGLTSPAEINATE